MHPHHGAQISKVCVIMQELSEIKGLRFAWKDSDGAKPLFMDYFGFDECLNLLVLPGFLRRGRFGKQQTHGFDTVFIHFLDGKPDVVRCHDGFALRRQMIKQFNDKTANGIVVIR